MMYFNKGLFFVPSLPAKKANISLLFVQLADRVGFQPKSKGCYRLVLSGIRDNLLYFSDRPNRLVGHISNKEFLSAWQQQKIHPNTVVHDFFENNKHSTTQVLTFSEPSYLEPATENIIYHACITDPAHESSLHFKILYQVSLFFDDFESTWRD